MTKKREVVHRLLASGGGFYMDRNTGELHRWSDKTESGYSCTGGEGYGVCSCGSFSSYVGTRQARRNWHKQHLQDVGVTDDTYTRRNKRLSHLVAMVNKEVQNEDERIIVRTPVFLSQAQRRLFSELEPDVVDDLLRHYRRPKRRET